MNPIARDILMHYGMPRRSGRYPWGSGEVPYQHEDWFLNRVERLRKTGWKETSENVRKEFGMGLEEYRNEKAWLGYARRYDSVKTAERMRDKEGMSNSEIARKMGVNESTVRSWFTDNTKNNMKQAEETALFLEKRIKKDGMIDVGKGVEHDLNISRTRLDYALYYLEKNGYPVYSGRVPNPTNPNFQTTQMVVCKPGTKHEAIYDFNNVHTVKDYISRDDGKTFEKKFHYPESMDSKRLKVRYSEEGGLEKDGLVEIRRGVQDLSLGESRYAQVRILVDNKKYIKGMAVYGDNKDFPDGVDVIFNTNKSKKLSKMEVLKDISKDPDNPFGSLIKDADQGGQYWYTDSKTGKKKLGLINKRSDQGDWTDWKDALPSQFLSKQSLTLAKKQLDLAKAEKAQEFDDIVNLTNPTIKKMLLNKFADECDSAAVHLQAAALPRQKYHVIIPVNTLKDDEVFAPRYKDGEKLALIRYPHGGTFEIPILTVNNGNSLAKRIIGTDSQDAIGIKKSVADRLSGADFDGDTVMCIPTHDRRGKIRILSTPPLKELEGFDNKMSYGYDDVKVDAKGNSHYYRNGHEYPVLKNTDTQMGRISNLITDMQLSQASDAEMARAVKHSMVVIDAEKHKLDYKASEKENNIEELRRRYQIHYDENGNITKYGGASTIISRAKGIAEVDKRQGSGRPNLKDKPWYDPSRPEGAMLYKTADPDKLYKPVTNKNKDTGIVTITTSDGRKISYNPKDSKEAKLYKPTRHYNKDTGEVTFTNPKGDIIYKKRKIKQDSTQMAETDNPYTLVSKARHPMELIYADHATYMKTLANDARKESARTPTLKQDPGAKKTYREEINSLKTRVNEAEKNAVRERAAIRRAAVEIKEKQALNENMSKEDLRKISQQSISRQREIVGTKPRKERSIKITDREWLAIQSGAVSDNLLKRILNNADIDSLRARATPKKTREISQAVQNRIKRMSASNYTIGQIAQKLGISPSTVSKYLHE